METARADNLLAKDNLSKLKLAIIKGLTASQAQPDRRDSKSHKNRRTRENSLALPRRASKSPDRSRVPYEVVDYQPMNGRTTRSPTRKRLEKGLRTRKAHWDAAENPPVGIESTGI
jgi:hypothetical protein